MSKRGPSGPPLSLTVCLARVMRRVIVASGTRNARAISAVVRPPTARSVSAICDAVDNDGWQHKKSRISESSASERAAPTRSAPGANQPSGNSCRATVSSRRRLDCSLRNRSVSRRDATVMSHARGLSGTPSRGHCVAAARNASWAASSARIEMPVTPDDRAENLRRKFAQQVLDIRHRGRHTSRYSRPSMMGRTSAYRPSAPSGPGGHWDMRAASSVARSKLGHSTIV